MESFLGLNKQAPTLIVEGSQEAFILTDALLRSYGMNIFLYEFYFNVKDM